MKIGELSHCFFCTGARNQSLLREFNSSAITFEIDERIASFKALGMAKVLNKPIAVCTTSGTAVSECLSALIEAHLSEVPLLLITADRPKRMQGSGAPQTIDHEIITRGYRKTYLELNPEEVKCIDLNLLDYPVHINVVIEGKDEIHNLKSSSFESNWSGFEKFLKDHPRPVIILSHANQKAEDVLSRLTDLKLPLYAEVMSGLHHRSPIRFEQDLLQGLMSGKFTSVIRIGHTPLTKLWRMLEGLHLPVFSFDSRNLPALSYGPVMPLGFSDLLDQEKFWMLLKEITPFEIELRSTEQLLKLLHEFPDSEVSTLASLQEHIPEGSDIYLGNSLTIRFFELIQSRHYRIWGNRGVNGIDGQLATAKGIALGLGTPLYCILGDLTLLYDLSSLMDLPENLKLIIMNNKGGRIFETLKMPQEIVLAHETSFEAIASAFDLSYARNNLSHLSDVAVMELTPDNQQTMELLKRWQG